MHIRKSYWGDVLLTTAYLIDWIPCHVLNFKTPIEVLSPPFSSSNFVIPPPVFGCACFIQDHGSTRGKLDPQALKYSPTQKVYKCYHLCRNNILCWLMSLSLNHNLIFPLLILLFKGRIIMKRNLWVLCLQLLLCQNMKIIHHLLRSHLLKRHHLLMSCVSQKSKTTSSQSCQAMHLDLGNPISTPSLNFSLLAINDIDHPIAQCKWVRSCTRHLIFNFVSYQHLSLLYRSLVSKLSSMSIPQNSQKTWWKEECWKRWEPCIKVTQGS